jgi:hypothetical protein
MSIFNGQSGRKPQTEARMYLYRCVAAALDNGQELSEGGWFGLPEGGDEFDRRRLKKAVESVMREMIRKGGGDPRLSAQGPFQEVPAYDLMMRSGK